MQSSRSGERKYTRLGEMPFVVGQSFSSVLYAVLGRVICFAPNFKSALVLERVTNIQRSLKVGPGGARESDLLPRMQYLGFS